MGRGEDSARRRRIGFLSADVGEPFQRELLDHALRAARDFGVELVATAGGVLGSTAGPETYAYDVVRGAHLDGILICAHTVCRWLTQKQIAEFAHGFEPAKVVTIGVPVTGLCSHTTDNRAGAAALADHLIIEHERKNFVVVRGPRGHREAESRLQGLKEALARHGVGLPEDRVIPGAFTQVSGQEAAELILKRFPGLRGVDAVVCANDVMAIAVLDVFARERISVPASVSVVGFDDIEIAHLARSPLTTVRQPLARQVTRAFADLLAELDGSVRQGTTEHPTELVLRRSCGCGLVKPEPSSRKFAAGGSVPAEDLQATLPQQRNSIADELSAAVTDPTLDRTLSAGWASDLVDAFTSRLCRNDPQFIQRIDAAASALVQRDESPTPLRDAVLRLRRQLQPIVEGAVSASERLADATAEALLAIGNVEALRQAQQRREFERMALELTRASAAFSSAERLDDLETIVYEQLEHLGIETCVPVLTEAATAGVPRIPFAYVGHTRRATVSVPDGDELPGFASPTLHHLLVPMVSEGRPLGYALFHAEPETSFLTTRFALALGTALKSVLLRQELEQAYARIAEQALRDPLTNVWNRRFFSGRLREEIFRIRRSGAPLSACAIDLDGFKQVNDRHGHEAGDQVLIAVAERLADCIRTNDVVARFGGDEFVVLMADTDEEAALAAAERVVSALREIDGFGLVTASVGAATLPGSVLDDDAGQRILREADAALLEAKRRGKCQAVHHRQLSSV
jgi:diguanylate cyclase (GGDEF)-like protein